MFRLNKCENVPCFLPFILWSFLHVVWSFSLSLPLSLGVNGPLSSVHIKWKKTYKWKRFLIDTGYAGKSSRQRTDIGETRRGSGSMIDPSFDPPLQGMWKKMARLPCWPSRGRQVQHQRWISGNMLRVHLHQVWIKLPTLALKPRGNFTRSLKQGY